MSATLINTLAASSKLTRLSCGVYAAIISVGLLCRWLSTRHPSVLPFWAPWDFSWIEFGSAWLALWWYVRGVIRSPPDERPSVARQVSFFAGILVLYAVLQTHFLYLAEHEFFVNRIQHVCMHHLGPLLIALAWPGTPLLRGMPSRLATVVMRPQSKAAVRFIQQPVLAGVLFVGLIFFWLIPSVHFRAMVDPRLFSLMNWSMVVDGILFWCLVLDPRPEPPARLSFGARASLAGLVTFPQIAGGAIITFATRDLYPFYGLCGRIYPNLSATLDQSIGGMIIWIPPAMMSALSVILVANAFRRTKEHNTGGYEIIGHRESNRT